MKIILKHNKSFKWYTNHTIFFIGYFYVDDVFYEKENALNYLLKIKTNTELKAFFTMSNGVFTILKKEKNSLLITVDITRSFPVFYTHYKDELVVSDDIFNLKNNSNLNDFNVCSEIELKAANHTFGRKTLIENIYQVQASECLKIDQKTILKSSFTYSYAIKKESVSDYKTLKTTAINAFENSFKRLILSVQNRTLVIPLSGGFDSRLIATILKKHNYKNVVCYTYGKKDSFEIENSKKTAQLLDFKWHFIEYNEHFIHGFLDSEEFKNYAHYAGKLSSMPNFQEYFAVKYLKENNLIRNDAIFVPGYAGDILGGSEYLKSIPIKINHSELADSILEKKMTNYHFTKQEKNQLKREIENNLSTYYEFYHQKIPETVLDDHNIKERIAKYIFNSASFYTFFGYEFRFPFWDKDLLDFFKTVPVQFKINKTLFDDVLINHYFKPFNVYFENELHPIPQKKWIQKIKRQLKPFLPTFIKEKKVSDNDWNNYKIITEKMLTFLKNKGVKVHRTYNDYNEIITQWYIYISKNGFD